MKKKILAILIILALWLLGFRITFDKDYHKTHTPVKPSYGMQVYWIRDNDLKFYKEFIWTTEFGRGILK